MSDLRTHEDKALLLPSRSGESIQMTINASELVPNRYIKISANAKNGGWNSDRWNMATITSYLEDKNGIKSHYRWFRINNKIGNPTYNLWGGTPDVWQDIKYYTKMPENIETDLTFVVFMSNTCPVDLWIKKFDIDMYSE